MGDKSMDLRMNAGISGAGASLSSSLSKNFESSGGATHNVGVHGSAIAGFGGSGQVDVSGGPHYNYSSPDRNTNAGASFDVSKQGGPSAAAYFQHKF